MRYKDIVEAPDWGSMSKRSFKRAELQHELGHEDDPNFMRKQGERITYFKIPIDLKWAANENRLGWDGQKGLWYRKWNTMDPAPRFTNNVLDLMWNSKEASYVNGEKAAATLDALRAMKKGADQKTSPEAPATSPAKPDIKMTHLHYFNVDDAQAASAGMKKDKKGRWYLPQYNTSGAKFRSTLADLTAKFGSPKTVTLS
jgi:hypothetical protein